MNVGASVQLPCFAKHACTNFLTWLHLFLPRSLGCLSCFVCSNHSELCRCLLAPPTNSTYKLTSHVVYKLPRKFAKKIDLKNWLHLLLYLIIIWYLIILSVYCLSLFLPIQYPCSTSSLSRQLIWRLTSQVSRVKRCHLASRRCSSIQDSKMSPSSRTLPSWALLSVLATARCGVWSHGVSECGFVELVIWCVCAGHGDWCRRAVWVWQRLQDDE